jgi:sn-glycerol 3-phosphate transport system ATP-binding protein/multiple sugar transport system ATP-binding protein
MSDLQVDPVSPSPTRGASASRTVDSSPGASTGESSGAKPVRCSASGVKKAFGAQPILRGVDLEIEEGSFAVLVGPSGCGKSTLLRLIAGLEQADEGSIHLAGRDVTRLPPRDRDVAMVFQSYALYPHLTVRDNLAFGLKLRGTASAEIESRIREASAMLSLDALLTRLPKQLSGGQRQRVAMGRAIVRRPTLFLFDEPLSNLDAALRAEVRVEIRRLHDRLGATTLYVTHDQVEAMTLADTLWVMNGGHVEQSGKPLAIYERPRTKFVAGFMGSPQINFLVGTLREEAGAVVAEGAGFVLPVDETRFGANLTPGRKVTVGVRPHDFKPLIGEAASGAMATATLRIEIVEALGFEAFAHGWVSASGPRVIVRLEASQVAQTRGAGTLPLTVDAADVHLFDAVTGLSLSERS